MNSFGKTIIIAEAGVNHNGSFELAKKLINAAADAGVDYVKFQTFKAEKLVTYSASKAEYQVVNTGIKEETQIEMLRKLELSNDEFVALSNYCKEKNIGFLSTPFDLETVDFLNPLIPFFKIPSGEITNYPYLKKIAKLSKPVVLSTGMCTMEDISNALELLLKYGLTKDLVTILHCNTEYPTPMEDVNLTAMLTIRDAFGVKIGYSDHTLGIEVPIAAVAIGAQVIEKHFTLDKTMEGPDHIASLDPDELKQMVIAIRNIEKALGSGVKMPSESELKNMAIARKSIIASCKISKGDIYSEENLAVKRPGTGISPMKWEQVIGMVASRDFSNDDIIEENI
jgi:N,N'-diacetyllegionaminate synthase